MNSGFCKKNDIVRLCAMHGQYKAKHVLRDLFTACPDCVKESDKKRAEKERLQKIEDWHLRLEACGISDRFKDKTLLNFKQDTKEKASIVQFAKKYVDFQVKSKSGKSLIFVGKVGSGKTHIATGIAIELIKKDNYVIYTTVSRMIRAIKDGWGERGIKESESIERFVVPKLLVIDEIGLQYGSKTENLLLFEIINRRYEENKPVILISNLNLNDLAELMGERVMDRLKEDGGKVRVFNWGSFRVI